MYFYSAKVFRAAGIPEHQLSYAALGTGLCELFTSVTCVSPFSVMSHHYLSVYPSVVYVLNPLHISAHNTDVWFSTSTFWFRKDLLHLIQQLVICNLLHFQSNLSNPVRHISCPSSKGTVDSGNASQTEGCCSEQYSNKQYCATQWKWGFILTYFYNLCSPLWLTAANVF